MNSRTSQVVMSVTLWILIAALLVAQSIPDPTTAARNRAFVNGRVFNGQRFVAEPLYVTTDGLFSRSRPSGAADAQEAAQRRVTVVTTVSDLLGATERGLRGFTPSDSEAFRALIRGNLSVLKAAGVSIALGSDNYQVTSEAEARTIGALGLFSPLEVLRMWSVVTPTMIFPARKIARLDPGYEASFLVVDGDPTSSVENLFRIVTRVKQGVVLSKAL